MTINVTLAITVVHADKLMPISRGAADAVNVVAPSLIAVGAFN
jgi:hypothetical protein